MSQRIFGFHKPAVDHKQVCDYDGAGHNRIIQPKKGAWIVREGKAQGLYHGPHCYRLALNNYEQIQKELGVQSEAEV